MQNRSRSLSCRIVGCLGLITLCAGPAAAQDLMDSVRLALQNDAAFQAALASNRAGQEALPQATAQLLPSLSLSGSRSKNTTDSDTPGLVGRSLNKSTYISSNTTLALRQPLFRMAQFAQYFQAKAQVRNADAILDKERQNLLVRVSKTYFDVLLAQQDLRLMEAQSAAYSGQLESARRGLKAGSGTRTDIDDAQARLDLGHANELKARQNVATSLRQLEVITATPVAQLAPLDGARLALLPPQPSGMEDWVNFALDHNPELQALGANIEIANREVEKNLAGHLPTVDLFVQRSKSQSDTNYTINSQYMTSSAGVQFNVPIWSSGEVSSRVRQARATLERAQQVLEQRRREISLEVRGEYQNVEEGILKVQALQQAERSARQAVLSNRKGLQAGTRSQLDILNAQQQLTNVQRDLLQAQSGYVLAQIRLLALMNSLNADELAVFNGWLTQPEAPSGG